MHNLQARIGQRGDARLRLAVPVNRSTSQYAAPVGRVYQSMPESYEGITAVKDVTSVTSVTKLE